MIRQGNILSFDEARRTARNARLYVAVPKSVSGRQSAKKPSKRNPSMSFDAKKLGTQTQKTESTLKMSKFSEFKRRHSKSKVSREFTKQFGDTTASAAVAGPRAALYKGEMGRRHKKAAQMQQSNIQKNGTRRFVFGFGWKSSPKFLATVMVSVCLVLAGAFLYPAAKQYYVTLRQHDQLAAEYQAVRQRNEDIQKQVEALSTPEGIEDRARAEFGWVKQGENAVIVYGLENSQEEATYASTIPAGSIEAPETWYSPILDFLFGIE